MNLNLHLPPPDESDTQLVPVLGETEVTPRESLRRQLLISTKFGFLIL
jgi:hypothetical protein